jgi:hypothetical protein
VSAGLRRPYSCQETKGREIIDSKEGKKRKDKNVITEKKARRRKKEKPSTRKGK